MAALRRPDRRTMLAGAAWAAPAIVLATASPALAVSGPALVTTTIGPTSDVNDRVAVKITYSNANTGRTGRTLAAVRFQVAGGLIGNPLGTVTDAAPTEVSPDWAYVDTSGSDTDRTFNFVLAAPGLNGAVTAAGPAAPTSLNFTVAVTRSGLPARSNGAISTITTPAPGMGTITNGTGAWS